jgi:hypothetical protein
VKTLAIVRRLTGVLALAAGLWAGASPAGAQTAIPKPMDFGTDQVLAAVVAPDADALIRRIEAVAATFAPQEVKPGTIRAQLGESLADPGLSQLVAGKPAALVLLKRKEAANPLPALFLPLKAPDAYGAQISNEWMKAKVFDGFVVITAASDDPLVAIRAFAPAYQKAEKEAIHGDLRLYAHLGRLMQVYGPVVQEAVDGFMSQIATLVPPAAPDAAPGQGAGMAKMLKLEAKALLAALGWIDEVQVDLALSAEAVTTETVFAAKPGSPLVDFFSTPSPGRNPGTALLSGPGVMAAALQLDAGRLGAFMVKGMETFAGDPDMAPLLTPEIKAMYTGMDKWFGSSMAMVMRSPNGKGFSGEFAMAVSDEAAYLAMMEKGAGLMAPGGPVGELYKSMGMPMSMSLEKNVRQYGGVPVHRYRVTFDIKGLPEAQAAQMKAMMKDNEFACVKGWMVGSQEPAALDALIDRAQGKGAGGGLSLHAVKVFGEGRHGYFDFDFAGLMKATLSLMPAEANPMAGMFGALKPGEPMTFAMTLGDGRALAQSRVPLDPFIQMAKAAQAGLKSPAPPEDKEK